MSIESAVQQQVPLVPTPIGSGDSGRRLRRRKVAPDGGWGYLVLLGMVVCFIATFGEMSCVGLLFGDFLAHLGHRTSALAALPGCYYMASSLVGAATNWLFRRYSVRTVGLCGAAAFVAGSVAAAAATSLRQLLLGYGLLQGVGFGIMLAASYTQFNRYFVRRRVLAMAAAQTLLGLGNMALPVGVQWLLAEYGYRGAMAVVAAMNAHVVAGMLVMQPVGWHEHTEMVLVEEVEEEKEEQKDEVEEEQKKEMVIQQRQQTTDVGNAGNLNADGSPLATAVWPRIVRLLDLGLFGDRVYVNIAVGMALTLYSDVAFFTVLPVYLRERLDFGDGDGGGGAAVAAVVSLCAAADLAARFVLTLLSCVMAMRARLVFLAGVLGTIVTRLVFQQMAAPLSISAAAAAVGFFRAWIHVPIAIVFADHLPAERFPSGYGLFMVVQGVLMFGLGPLAGYVHDWTGSWAATFHVLTAALAACAVPWSLELWSAGRRSCQAERRRRRRRQHDGKHDDVKV